MMDTKLDITDKDENDALVDEALPLGDEKDDIEIDAPKTDLIYGVLDTPPIHITIICGLQVRVFFL